MGIGQMERGGYRPDEEEFKTPGQIVTEAIEKQHEAEEKFREELLTKEKELFEKEIPEETPKEKKEEVGLKKILKLVKNIGEKVVENHIPGFNGKLEKAIKGGIGEMLELHFHLRICRLKLAELSDSDREKLVESNIEKIKILGSRLEQEKDENEKVEIRHFIKELEQDNRVLEAFKQGIKLL